MRYFMRLAYRGANFHGWQTQPNDVSVQETLEQAMTMVMRTPIKITDARHVDAGQCTFPMGCHLSLSNRVIKRMDVELHAQFDLRFFRY